MRDRDQLAEYLLRWNSAWYSNLASKYGDLPRSFASIDGHRTHMVFIMDELELNHVERNHFVRRVLQLEGALAFSYAGLVGAYDESTQEIHEHLLITAGTAHRYLIAEWAVIRPSEQRMELSFIETIQGSDPEKYPSTWFLSATSPIPDEQVPRLDELWARSRSRAEFRVLQD